MQTNKISIESASNPKWAGLLSRRINAWADYNGVLLTDFVFREYSDESDNLVYHRPHIYHDDLFSDERSGMSISFNLEPIQGQLTSNQVQVLLTELIGRLYNDAWPKELQSPDYDIGTYYPFHMAKDSDDLTGSCWHHKSITFNRAFCINPIFICKIEHGYCHCS